ncbi:MAG: PSD1 domain-containing protein [Pirellulaceae bacterium]|nr:PSD1 domain-containing protein [Pirellulaceae bacterium]
MLELSRAIRGLACCLPLVLLGAPPLRADDLSFVRDIQPLLARHCFACHGPDEEHREADLRLDQRQAAVDSGAIVPGKPDESELVRRVLADDADQRMPPPAANDTLTAEEKELLRRWIEAGADYQPHWAFQPPVRPPLPEFDGLAADMNKWAAWPRNPIDRFVLRRLLDEGLTPAAEADRYTLVRRLYLDLLGLPPTPEEADAFVADSQPDAYQRLVDRLLESKHYGERWARLWLDLARYSDTNGYEKDRPRSAWPYRDWVIRALNDDLPFDQFTVEQLAGDMLPGATIEQRIATGFHRQTMLNEEGGIDPLEFRFYALVDRVATTGTVWLGLTTGCAQCHSHKYDPISHTDYYRLLALLNNADEPDLQVPDPRVVERREQLQREIARLESELPGQFPPADGEGPVDQRRAANLEGKFAEWLEAERPRAVAWKTLRPRTLETNLPRLEAQPDGSIFSSGDITKRDVFRLSFTLQEDATALRLEVLPDPRLPAGGPGRAYYEGRQGDFFLSEVSATSDGQPVAFSAASHSFGKISIGSGSADAGNVLDGDGSTGWSTAGRESEAHQLVLNLAQPLPAGAELQLEMLFERHFAASLGRFRWSSTSAGGQPRASQLPVEIEDLLGRQPPTWNDAERSELRRHYLRVAPELAEARRPIDALRKQMPELPTTLVFEERPADNPRPTFRHHRGEYLSPREEVAPGLPAVFSSDAPPADRLQLARWLASDRNPLVARVSVNRAWRALFGAGLVRTSGDFGTQSEPPTHPELLDWLACEFMERGWSQKQLHRLIVTSATYRQDSSVSEELLRRDPLNLLLARGPRFRVDAELVRDIMLRASGLLSDKMYGPSVYPPQLDSVTALAYGNTPWPQSQGEDRYRRSLYTFSKRTAPFAAYLVFDGPTGETCTARRDRSNTPLQALTLLNDAMYLELARALAERAVGEADGAPQRAAWMFRRVLTRPPEADEIAVLVEFQQRQRQRLEAGELKAEEIGGPRADAKLAAWVMTARVIMNLDEAITRP